jgi:pimeloyl-ACP methyl ester carboxylesterase
MREDAPMPRFETFDGIELAFDDEGEGTSVLLLHGFAADADINWRRPGVIDALVADGRRVISFDARGHGRSDKPHDPKAYGGNAMVKDAAALLDHLGVGDVDVAGYSMGALVTLRLLGTEPRVRSAVLGGIGGHAGPKQSDRARIADALEADDPSAAGARAKAFRSFADTTGADLRALAAIQRAQLMMAPVDLTAIRVPVLVLVGDRDDLAQQPEKLAARISGATVEIVSGTHLSAVSDPKFTQAIVGFVSDQVAKRG